MPNDPASMSDNELWELLAHAQGQARIEVLSELADRAVNRNDLSSADSLLSEIVSTAQEILDTTWEADTLARRAGLAFRSGEFTTSVELYGRAADVFAGSGRDREVARALWGQADAFRRLGDWPASLTSAERAVDAARSASDNLLAGDSTFLKARALYWLDEDEQAWEACFVARDYLRHAEAPHQVFAVDDFAITIGLYLDRLDDALALAQGCLEYAKDVPSRASEPYARKRLGEVYLRRGDLSLAVQNLDQARSQFREEQDLLGVAYVDLLRSQALFRLGEYEESRDAARSARVLLDAHGRDYDALQADVSRAVVLHTLGEFDKAVQLNRTLVRKFSSGEDELEAQWSAVRLLENLFEAQQFSACLTAFDELREVWGEEPAADSRTYLDSLGLRAAAMAETGRTEEAAQLAGHVIESTTAAQAGRTTGLCYEVRGLTRLAADEPGALQDLAHAIALHLASGDSIRAEGLSQHFMPADPEPQRKPLDSTSGEHEPPANPAPPA